MSGKRKYPRAEAVAVAKELCDGLKQRCERLIVAGSLRRRKPEVGDVEILYVPKLEPVEVPSDDLLLPPKTALVDQVDAYLDWLLEQGTIRPRENVRGATTWGAKNKLAVHAASGMPVDFFAATVETLVNYLVCRTGPAELNMRICMAAQDQGWKWNPYGEGFTKIGSGQQHAVKSEQEVFEFVGLRYLEPWHRG